MNTLPTQKIIFRRAQEKQVSVAGQQKKGKSRCVEQARRTHRRWPGARVVLKVEQQQDEENHDGKHKNAETFSRAVNAPR